MEVQEELFVDIRPFLPLKEVEWNVAASVKIVDVIVAGVEIGILLAVVDAVAVVVVVAAAAVVAVIDVAVVGFS